MESKYNNCKSLCLALGPYRNLTTLTASVLFLHPNCQVLNHAGDRIFGSDIDFLNNFSTDRVSKFINHAIEMSGGGMRGDYGGSITLSHAFDPNLKVKDLFEQANLSLIKPEIHCLFWKESHRLTNLIHEKHIDLAPMLDREPRLRFLMPIRNPMDCAISNLKTGHVKHFRTLGNTLSVAEVVSAILNEIKWFDSLKQLYPNRFFYFFEHSINNQILIDLAHFMNLAPLDSWLEKAREAISLKPGYPPDNTLISAYRTEINQKFSDNNTLRENLLAFGCCSA
jgi:hypothetical protein